MASFRKRVVDCVYLESLENEPPRKKQRTEIETIRCVIHDFATRRWFFFYARTHERKWNIFIYSKGDNDESRSLSIWSENIARVTARVAVRCNSWKTSPSKPFTFENDNDKMDFDLPRQYFLKHCLEKDGSLVLECDIQVTTKDSGVWYPATLQQDIFLVDVYQDASSNTADVVFSVGNAMYRCHKNVLSQRCKKLFDMAEESSDCTIPICSTRKEIFRSILDYVYTVREPEIRKEGIAVELLVAADLYECVDLKLFAESVLVDRFLTAENTARLLILADSHSCALLKEAATDLYLKQGDVVERTPDWPRVQESTKLLMELLRAARSSSEKKQSGCGSDGMTVSDLRQELYWAGLAVDGSREVLVSRWKALTSAKANDGEIRAGGG